MFFVIIVVVVVIVVFDLVVGLLILTILMSTFAVGLLFAEDEYKRLVDKGPSAEDKEAVTAYKQLWGDMVEVRRFRCDHLCHFNIPFSFCSLFSFA